LKNLRALENIRNTTANHILIDYRIACAMINFDFKPCCPDGKNGAKIAKKIKHKAAISSNSLQFLLNKQLGTNDIPKILISEINDFPRLKESELVEEIFLGTFLNKVCKSYVEDILNNKIAFVVKKNILEKNEKNKNSQTKAKIIAMQVSSRHKRSKIKHEKHVKKKEKTLISEFRTYYKVFIQYVPNIDSYKSIQGKNLLNK
jgi:hypothetical protein